MRAPRRPSILKPFALCVTLQHPMYAGAAAGGGCYGGAMAPGGASMMPGAGMMPAAYGMPAMYNLQPV